GMNFIAGYLILITKNEEESFWLLDALETLCGAPALPPHLGKDEGHMLRSPPPEADYYSPAMLGLKTDQEVLGELVRTKLPAVATLMDGHSVPWTLVVSRWFICLFVDILPVETVLRVWDCLFSEGSKIIFRVALTLIKQHQSSILGATSVADVCEKFKEITKGTFVTECHTFMQVGAGCAQPVLGHSIACGLGLTPPSSPFQAHLLREPGVPADHACCPCSHGRRGPVPLESQRPENILTAWKLVHGHHRQASRELQGQATGTGLMGAPPSPAVQ
ncbi:hypothetical protein MC885_014270, partial [Smutsia gigantea]